MIGSTEVQIFRLTNQGTIIRFFLLTEGVYKNTSMTAISVKASTQKKASLRIAVTCSITVI